jgi:polysaccharide biosynthesis transport protein
VNHSEVQSMISAGQDDSLRSLNLHSPTRGPGLQTVTRLVTRRLKWIVGSVLGCLLLALIITATTRPVYQATSTIELNRARGDFAGQGLAELLSQQIGSDDDNLLTDLQTETAILQGDSLALAVIQKLNLASQPPFAVDEKDDPDKGLSLENAPRTRTRLLQTFKSGLIVSPIRGTRLIQVTYESHDPAQAATIANALIEGYKNQYLQSHYQATSETSNWLAKQLSDLKTNVEDSERKLTDFEKENGILGLSITPVTSGTESTTGEGQIRSPTIQKLEALNTEVTTAEANRIEKEAIYRLAQSKNDDVILGLANDPLALQANSVVLTQGGGLSNLQQLRQQQNELKIGLAQASTTYGPNNRHLKDMETQLRSLNQQISQEIEIITKRAQGDFELAKRTEDELRQRFNEQQTEAAKLNEKTVQLAVLSQEAFSRKRLYEDLYTKLQEANVSAGLKATNITIVDPARTQSVPVRPKQASNLALGMLFGMFVGLSAAYVVDSFDRTVSDPLEVEQITAKPVIGVIPSFTEGGRTYGQVLPYKNRRSASNELAVPEANSDRMSIWMLDHPDSAPSEAFRVLRTSIMLSRPGGTLKTILVTGCTPGEGKTTVTANLGVAFAQHNKRVIIVEADLRRPKFKHKIDFPGKIGLSNLLTNSCGPEEAILRGVYVPTLDVLPAGSRPPMPSELLGSTEFDNLLEQLRAHYDLVLIDSPPALLVTDAVSISTRADGVIWVVHAGVITRPYLYRASHMIQRSGMPVIGMVVNRMSRRFTGYGYGYEYEMYGSHYAEDDQHES